MIFEADMSFYDTADFIESFRNGGCFIFEGEDEQTDNQKGDPDVTEEDPEDASLEETEGTDAPKPTQKDPDAETQNPNEDSNISDDLKETDAGNVNTDQPSQSKQNYGADQIVSDYKSSGALRMTLQYAMKSIGKVDQLKIKMLLPYIKAGIEQFCQKHEFNTTVDEIAKAIMITLKSLDAKEVQKEKMKAAQAKKAAEQKEATQQSQGDEGSAPEAGGEEAPAEEAPAPDEGGEESPEQEEA